MYYNRINKYEHGFALWKENEKMIEIARIHTFATTNRRDIVRRLMGACKAFKNLIFADALAQYRYYEKAGLVKHGDGYIVIYHDCN